MGQLLKEIFRAAKGLYNANSNNQLGEYVGDKIANIVNRYDGTTEEEFEARKEQMLKQIQEELNSETCDGEYCLALIDRWVDEYAQIENDLMLASYCKYCAWKNIFNSVGEERRQKGYRVKPDEEEALDEKEKEANAECLKWIQSAIDHLDEDYAEIWICTLFTAKAERLHWLGHDSIDKHVEAVRLAIQVLPFAYDEDDRERAKASITGKVVQDSTFVYPMGGYGIWGFCPNDLVQKAKEQDEFVYIKDSSLKDNEEMMDICAMELSESVESYLYDKNNFELFSNRPYHDRQFIFTVRDLDHIGGCYDETDNIKYVFPLDELPGGITFPIGHPQPNTLYYAHPLRPMYLPFENAQLLLFYEKVHEMCRLFQCLGATQISARCLKGDKVSQEIITSSDFDVEGEYKIVNASGGFHGKAAMSGNRESRDEMQLNQSFSPRKAPYCPDDLLWAKADPELRTLIQQRLEGGLLEFTKKVSSYETSNLSQNQVNDVKAAFQNLMMNVSTNYSASTDTTFSQTTETEWEISVQFKPLDEFKDYVSPTEMRAKAEAQKGDLIMEDSMLLFVGGVGIVVLGTLQADVKVGEQVIVCTDDTEFDSEIKGIMMFFKWLPEGEAGDKACLRLNGVTALNFRPGTKIYRKRESGNIAVKNIVQRENADKQTIEKTETLTSEEEQYKEEILFCLEDNGVITEEDRRYLERKRKKFGISEERAKEIERQTAPSLSDDEKEYLETYKELTSSGVLSERAKRLLERERESLNISKERAEEIEKLAFAKLH